MSSISIADLLSGSYVGAQGVQGLQGVQSLQGAQGRQGLQGGGSQGTQGIQGAQGLQGLQGGGSQGTQGLQGTGFINIPAVGNQVSSYTLATTDVGKFVQVDSGGSIIIPNNTFVSGDIITIVNNTAGNVTITCNINTAYITGINADYASLTLLTRGVASVLFTTANTCFVTGSVL